MLGLHKFLDFTEELEAEIVELTVKFTSSERVYYPQGYLDNLCHVVYAWIV